MKYVLPLILCIFILDAHAYRRPRLTNTFLCKTNPACQWTSYGCRQLNFTQSLHQLKHLDGDTIPLLGTAPLF